MTWGSMLMHYISCMLRVQCNPGYGGFHVALEHSSGRMCAVLLWRKRSKQFCTVHGPYKKFRGIYQKNKVRSSRFIGTKKNLKRIFYDKGKNVKKILSFLNYSVCFYYIFTLMICCRKQ